MKSSVKPSTFLSGRSLMLMTLVAIMISCSKSNNTPTNAAVSFCNTISWNDTDGRTGSFTGSLINGQYELTGVTYKEPLTTQGNVNFTYDVSGHLMNQTGLTVTYNGNNLVKYVVDLSMVSSATGTATYTFDTNGDLTNITAAGTNNNGPISYSVTYTYDSNGDPVHIVGHGTQTVSQGIGTLDYDIVADYLTDKASLLPNVPIAAPFTTYFAYQSFTSKHLVNKWVMKQNTSVAGVALPELDFTWQYSYQYDSNGRVSSFHHSGNPNNEYSFTYTGCN
jgi:uncharacterized lipoprotein YajG